MFCPKCEKQINDGSKFCRYCGTSIWNLEKKEVPRENGTIETKQQVYQSPKSSPEQNTDSNTGKVILITAAILVSIIVIIVLVKPNDVRIIPPNYMEKGNEALINKNYQEAISFFEKVSADSKDYQEAQNQITYARGMIIQSDPIPPKVELPSSSTNIQESVADSGPSDQEVVKLKRVLSLGFTLDGGIKKELSPPVVVKRGKRITSTDNMEIYGTLPIMVRHKKVVLYNDGRTHYPPKDTWIYYFRETQDSMGNDIWELVTIGSID